MAGKKGKQFIIDLCKLLLLYQQLINCKDTYDMFLDLQRYAYHGTQQVTGVVLHIFSEVALPALKSLTYKTASKHDRRHIFPFKPFTGYGPQITGLLVEKHQCELLCAD